MLKLPGHTRYGYSPIVKRPDYSWPGGKRLAFYIALNIEHFAFGAGLGMDPANRSGQQTRTFELRAALSLAKLYKTTGRDQLASELLAPALVGFNAGPEVPEVEQAQRLLTMHEPDRRVPGRESSASSQCR